MGLLLKFGNLFFKKPLGYVNGVIDKPNWKSKTAAVSGVLVSLAGIISEVNRLAPLDLNDISAIMKSEYALALCAAFYAFGQAKKQEKVEQEKPNGG